MAQERLQKILARAGVASRRKAEEIVASGRVRVDGRVVSELGTKADPKRSTIELDGRKLEPEQLCYGVFHKPRGMVTTLSDPEGRPTARDVLRQVGVRVVPVGRLDFNTSGALLFTNDGDFAQALTHASGKAPKVYAAKVTDEIDEASLAKWGESISIEGKRTRPAAVRILRREGKKTWLEITIVEGKNHQVRRLGEHAGTPVERLSRLSHAGISAEGLRPGQWRLLTLDELKDLKKQFGVPGKVRGMMQLPEDGGKRRSLPKRAVQARPGPRARAGESDRKSPTRDEKKSRIERKTRVEKGSRVEGKSRDERRSKLERKSQSEPQPRSASRDGRDSRGLNPRGASRDGRDGREGKSQSEPRSRGASRDGRDSRERQAMTSSRVGGAKGGTRAVAPSRATRERQNNRSSSTSSRESGSVRRSQKRR